MAAMIPPSPTTGICLILRFPIISACMRKRRIKGPHCVPLARLTIGNRICDG